MFGRNCTGKHTIQRAFWVGNNTGKKAKVQIACAVSKLVLFGTALGGGNSGKGISAGRTQTTKGLVHKPE